MDTKPKCPVCQGDVSALYPTDFPQRPLFYQCRACEFCFTAPPPTPAELQALYGETYSAKESWRIKNRKNAPDYWRKLKPHLPAGDFAFLEIGGAFGYLAKEVADRTAAQVTLLEAGETACCFAREQLGLRTHRTMLEDYRTEERFDVIFAAHVVEHLLHLEAFLAACARLLKPGGRLILLTPNAQAWKFRLLRREWGWAAPEQHTLFLSAAAARTLFSRAGLDIASIRTTRPSLANYPFLLTRWLSGVFTRLFGRATTEALPGVAADVTVPPEGPRASKFARLRFLGRPILWLEYGVLCLCDSLIDGGRARDELLIVATPVPES